MTEITKSYGALPDVPDERDWMLGDVTKKVHAPAAYEVSTYASLKGRFVKYQGSKPICVSCASAHIYETFNGGDPALWMEDSGDFIYWLAMQNGKATKKSGMYFRDAMKSMYRVGMVFNKMQPTASTWEETVTPSPDWVKIAYNRKIVAYARANLDKESLQDAIYKTGAIMIGVWATDFDCEMAVVRTEGGGSKRVNTGIIKPFQKQGNPHAVVAYGYDETGLKIRNSWGEKWGLDGDAIIAWNEVPKRLMTAWTVIDDNNPNIDEKKFEDKLNAWSKEARNWNESLEEKMMNVINGRTMTDEEILTVIYRLYLLIKKENGN